eukprot:Gregarina_sp_Poly_1__5776@NODE_3039_length_1434_cov_106_904901_g1923_i0_p4_GENE_NODE_3039_length_1434_cov_106_904901_g1923_i0NODE_3039_length_1434_cov_106_904901_g1923_i0_p4_ORF_typecomplete_len100_score13_12PHTB1_C/PF14728_6/0_033_NODE_3039_length_1434_cov_106_904901_g1923_i029301
MDEIDAVLRNRQCRSLLLITLPSCIIDISSKTDALIHSFLTRFNPTRSDSNFKFQSNSNYHCLSIDAIFSESTGVSELSSSVNPKTQGYS